MTGARLGYTPIMTFVDGVEVFAWGITAAFPLEYIEFAPLDQLGRDPLSGGRAHFIWLNWETEDPDRWLGPEGTMHTLEVFLTGRVLTAFGLSGSFVPEGSSQKQRAMRVVQVMETLL